MAKIKIVTKSDTYFKDEDFGIFIQQLNDNKGFFPFSGTFVPYHNVVKVEQLKEKLNG